MPIRPVGKKGDVHWARTKTAVFDEGPSPEVVEMVRGIVLRAKAELGEDALGPDGWSQLDLVADNTDLSLDEIRKALLKADVGYAEQLAAFERKKKRDIDRDMAQFDYDY